MISTRIFICYDIDQEDQQNMHILGQLRQRLETTGAQIITYSDDAADEQFLPFLDRELPACQWFILYQTPTAVTSPHVRQAVDTALARVSKGELRGILRFITAPTKPGDLPQSWVNIPAFDGTYDVLRAQERLLLALSRSQALPPLPPLSSSPRLPAAASAPSMHTIPAAHTMPATSAPHASAPSSPAPIPPSSFPSPRFDRPPTPSYLNRAITASANIYQDTITSPRRLAFTLLALVLIVLIVVGSLLFNIFPRGGVVSASSSKGAGTVNTLPSLGYVYFSSTDFSSKSAITHIADEINIDLQGLQQPTQGNSYYAWLLPDSSDVGENMRLIGQFVPEHGSAQLSYSSPTHDDLLATNSRFLITEENASISPDAPTANKSLWRYYAQISQSPIPTAPNDFSELDLLRYLLASSPATNAPAIKGVSNINNGFAVDFYQSVHQVLQEAQAMQSTPDSVKSPGAQTIRNHLISILDYLDGTKFVHLDVPEKTPVLVKENEPLLTIDPDKSLTGYIYELETYLLELANAEDSTQAQRTLAGQIDTGLDKVKIALQTLRQDAKELVSMSDTELLSSNSVPLLEDVVSKATQAYASQPYAPIAAQQGGATWVLDHIQLLAQLTVTAYSPQLEAAALAAARPTPTPAPTQAPTLSPTPSPTRGPSCSIQNWTISLQNAVMGTTLFKTSSNCHGNIMISFSSAPQFITDVRACTASSCSRWARFNHVGDYITLMTGVPAGTTFHLEARSINANTKYTIITYVYY